MYRLKERPRRVILLREGTVHPEVTALHDVLIHHRREAIIRRPAAAAAADHLAAEAQAEAPAGAEGRS